MCVVVLCILRVLTIGITSSSLSLVISLFVITARLPVNPPVAPPAADRKTGRDPVS